MRTSKQVKMTSTKIKIDKCTSSKTKIRRKRIYKNNIRFAHLTNRIDSPKLLQWNRHLSQPRLRRDGKNDLKRYKGIFTIVYYGKL